ncbi:MAG: quinolinate synthase NadA [Clostridiaceae bacterium]|mgnify:CR=1 FL=1|nr:quinolinate synthase NadA [Clostridiaceae bacterium]
MDYRSEILRLKEERDACIVAHYYQIGEIQDIADKVGDSFDLSRYCASTDKKTIVFCGVHFMAESAKILSPDKTVLLPAIDAGCPMADMADVEGLRKLKERYPEAAVVSYVNTTAAIKAESDICCTSSIAEKVVRSLPNKQIIFLPDRNLGQYVAKQVPEKEFIFWAGFCPTHNALSTMHVDEAREAYSNAELVVHPEAPSEVVELADFVGSTKQIIDYCTESEKKEFIIGTEEGILHQLEKRNPDKRFYMLKYRFICPNMKKTSMEVLYEALRDMKHEITLSDEISQKARLSLERMLQVK